MNGKSEWFVFCPEPNKWKHQPRRRRWRQRQQQQWQIRVRKYEEKNVDRNDLMCTMYVIINKHFQCVLVEEMWSSSRNNYFEARTLAPSDGMAKIWDRKNDDDFVCVRVGRCKREAPTEEYGGVGGSESKRCPNWRRERSQNGDGG